MASIDLIRASNGSGDAVKATVANARVISSTTLQVDATTNWPSKFIATVGDVDGTGAFVPATVTVFNGILSGSNIEITSFAPGYTDLGNTPGQIVVLKPTTAWANEVASTLGVAHNDNGTLKANSVTSTALADSNVTTPKIADGAVTPEKRSGGFNVGVISAAVLGTTGDKAITGVGFKPKLVRFTVMGTASTAAIITGVGAMTSTSQFYAASIYSGVYGRNSSTSACIGWVTGGSSTPYLLASYVSMDDDGFTINVGTANNAFSVAYEAYA